jgi:hypothetical protein
MTSGGAASELHVTRSFLEIEGKLLGIRNTRIENELFVKHNENEEKRGGKYQLWERLIHGTNDCLLIAYFLGTFHNQPRQSGLQIERLRIKGITNRSGRRERDLGDRGRIIPGYMERVTNRCTCPPERRLEQLA